MISTRQFYFSGLTGGFLMTAGASLLSVGVAGGVLFIVGAGITALSVAFRFQGRALPALQRLAIGRDQDNAVMPGLNNG